MNKKIDFYEAIIGLGSNLEFNGLSPQKIIFAAIQAIKSEKLQIIKISEPFFSKPWPLGTIGNDYTNYVVKIKTCLKPNELLKLLNEVENKFGRLRVENNQNAPRTLDIDIIDFNGKIINSDNLTLPHPRMHLREFVLYPLLEIEKNYYHPIINKSVSQLIEDLIDK